MKLIFNKTLYSVVLLSSMVLSGNAVSSIIVTGNLSYNNVTNIITDMNTDATYLGFDVLAGLSYDEVSVATSTGGEFADFHIASTEEGMEFFHAAGAGATSRSGSDWIKYEMDIVFDRFGDNFFDEYDSVYSFNQDSGLFDEITVWNAYGGGITLKMQGSTLESADLHTVVVSPPKSYLAVGNFSANIPEPTSSSLLGIGLAGFGFSRKKRKA